MTTSAVTAEAVSVAPIDWKRLRRVKFAFTTRRVARDSVATLLRGKIAPRSGDLVLARVLEIGHHEHVELTNSRRATLFLGDEIAVCYGNRYAPKAFEAEVPPDLGRCDLVAAGGLAAKVLSAHEDILRPPTTLMPIGMLGDIGGRGINLSDWALRKPPVNGRRPPTVAVVGTQMDSGKTTTAAYLVKGLVAAGFEVGAAKVTGTGAGKDLWFMSDAGAKQVLDFTDAGFPSTYKATPRQVGRILATLVGHLTAAGVDAIVLEIADGLFQRETAALVRSRRFPLCADGVVLAAHDSLGAHGGVKWLRRRGLTVLCVSGILTTSPLAIREAAAATGLPVATAEVLSDPSFALSLVRPRVGVSS